jgi:hypothetical protein
MSSTLDPIAAVDHRPASGRHHQTDELGRPDAAEPGTDRSEPGPVLAPEPGPEPDDLGQTTTEYALVTLGAAAVALLVMAWAGGTGKIGELLDAVVDRVIGGL